MTISAQILINGNYVGAANASVSVDERGFRFGDGVFETIPVHHGIPYLFEYHLERLEAGLKALRIICHLGNLLDQALGLIRANGQPECILRLYVSRGIGSKGYLPLPVSGTPTLVMQTLERPNRPEEAIRLWRSAYEKISPNALPTHCKLAQGLNPALARLEASERHCYDALQLSAQGAVAEASSANIFWLKDTILYTPSLASGALAGVTRRKLMELSPYKVQEGLFTLETLQQAEAVILCNATLGIVPVASLLPDHYHWHSTGLASHFESLRAQDIAEYTARTLESLA